MFIGSIVADASDKGARAALVEAGVELGSEQASRCERKWSHCVVSDQAMEKLDPYFGRFVWVLTPLVLTGTDDVFRVHYPSLVGQTDDTKVVVEASVLGVLDRYQPRESCYVEAIDPWTWRMWRSFEEFQAAAAVPMFPLALIVNLTRRHPHLRET